MPSPLYVPHRLTDMDMNNFSQNVGIIPLSLALIKLSTISVRPTSKQSYL